MANQVVLISIDGMRPDGLQQADTPRIDALLAAGRSTMHATTVMPSVTLPCHMAMFHSVPPERHGVTTNTWTPQVRPILGLADVLKQQGKICDAYFNWEQLRDLWRPGAMKRFAMFDTSHDFDGDVAVGDAAVHALANHPADFSFVYLGHTDAAGHDYTWMSDEYLAAIGRADVQVGRVVDALSNGATVIVTADHGGHDRTHGTTMNEDMLIPIVIAGPNITPGAIDEPASILDIAPTVASLLGAPLPPEWSGRALVG